MSRIKYNDLVDLAQKVGQNFKTVRAKKNGATDEEVLEAIALAASTSQWSRILQGSGISFEDFKAEVDAVLKFMEEKTKK